MIIHTILCVVVTAFSIPLFTGCAAGSAAAGYTVSAKSADKLSQEAEDHIIERVKAEVIAELAMKGLIEQK